MTNVVGILVILLTVTQLGVGDAVKRISTTDSVSPETLERSLRELKELVDLYNSLVKRLKTLVRGADRDAPKNLAQLTKKIEDYQADIAVLREGQRDKEQKRLLDLKKLQEEAKRLNEQQKKEAEELLSQLNGRKEELAKLRAQLAETPEQGPLPAKVVNLPNPRPAPEGTQPVTFICRQGRIMPLDVKALQQQAQKRADFIVRRRKLDRDPANGIDGEILAEEFNRGKIRSQYFVPELVVSGRYPQLVLERRKNAGQTAEQLKRSNSRYRQYLKRIDSKKYYLQFFVWPDSFETYLEARKIVMQRGLAAGWQAMTTSGEYTVGLGGKIRCGPPPPPAKPQPKPSTPPTPPPKPLLIDVVD